MNFQKSALNKKAHIVFHKSSNHSLFYECELFLCEAIYISHSQIVKIPGYCQPTYHSHPNYELHFVLEGTCEFELADKSVFEVKKNQFILFPPHMKHRITSESVGFQKFACLFSLAVSEDSKNSFYKTAEFISGTPAVKKATKSMRILAIKMMEYKDNKPMDFKNALLFSFMSFIIEMFQVIVGKNTIELKKTYNDKRLNDAIKYINENISANTTVEEVADFIHISKKQLERLFESILKTSPGVYIKNYHAKQIRNLLLNPDLSLDDIAESMEYNNVSSMIKFFKRIEGNTPQQFRKAIYKM